MITDGIRRVTENGIEVDGGAEHPVDVIVLATGFKANDFLWPMEVRGRDGQLLEQLWEKDGARAYLGTMVPGFPNLFMIYGPNTNATGGLGTFDFEEMVTRFALECIEHLVLEGKQSVDVTVDGYWRYNDELDRHEALKIYSDPRAQQLLPERARPLGGQLPVRRATDVDLAAPTRGPPAQRWSAGGAEPTPGGSDGVRPHFGEDLIVE